MSLDCCEVVFIGSALLTSPEKASEVAFLRSAVF